MFFLLLYTLLYNNKKYFLIYENVFLSYNTMYIKKCLLSLYTLLYNDNKHFLIYENVYRII